MYGAAGDRSDDESAKIVATISVVRHGRHAAQEVLQGAPAQAIRPRYAFYRREERSIASPNVPTPLDVVGIVPVADRRIQIELQVIVGIDETREGDGLAELQPRAVRPESPPIALDDAREDASGNEDVTPRLALADELQARKEHSAGVSTCAPAHTASPARGSSHRHDVSEAIRIHDIVFVPRARPSPRGSTRAPVAVAAKPMLRAPPWSSGRGHARLDREAALFGVTSTRGAIDSSESMHYARRRVESAFDVVVVGAGPNGLAAAITCARAQLSVLLVEGHATVGGGARSAELTLPGFVHDVCSAIHPLALVSPFFRSVPLCGSRPGVDVSSSPSWLTRSMAAGRRILERSLDATAATLDGDGPAYERVFAPFVARADDLYGDTLGPLRIPRHPALFARFGLQAMQSTSSWRSALLRASRSARAGRGLLRALVLASPGAVHRGLRLMLGISGHAVGWPCARSGSQRIADAMAAYLVALGGDDPHGPDGRVDGGATVREGLSVRRLPGRVGADSGRPHPSALPCLARAVPTRARRLQGRLGAEWAHSVGSDERGDRQARCTWAERLKRSKPARRPWRAGSIRRRPSSCSRSRRSPMRRARRPAGHTGWAYCHVPWGSTARPDCCHRAQVERFAPGFRDRIAARHAMSPSDYAAYNPNNVGGDICGGANDVLQLFTRPVARPLPYATPARRHLPVLQRHPAGRRSARNVRLLRCENRAPNVSSASARSSSSKGPDNDPIASLVDKLFPEVLQTERSAVRHPKVEARRLGACPPASALLAVAGHATRAEAQLAALAERRGKTGSMAGLAVGSLFSIGRNRIADFLLTMQASYRGTLLGIRHGYDVVTLFRLAALSERDAELVSWCDAWLAERAPLIETVASSLSWFAEHPESALRSAKLG